MTLFRREVVEASQDRLHGEVVFSQPLSTKLFAGALFVVLAIAAIWVSVGTYARIETIPGILVTDVPSAKVVASQPDVVVDLNVEEGLATPFFLQISIDTVFPTFGSDLLLMLALGFGGLAVVNLLASWLRSLALVTLSNALSLSPTDPQRSKRLRRSSRSERGELLTKLKRLGWMRKGRP